MFPIIISTTSGIMGAIPRIGSVHLHIPMQYAHIIYIIIYYCIFIYTSSWAHKAKNKNNIILHFKLKFAIVQYFQLQLKIYRDIRNKMQKQK